MVAPILASTWTRLSRTGQSLQVLIAPPEPPAPGLYTYRVVLDGGQTRLHLRIERDGRGVLFRDVSDVFHLNPTAAEIAKLALDGMPMPVTRKILQARYYSTDRAQITQDVGEIYDLVATLRRPDLDCTTCALPYLPKTELFSTAVQAPYKADLALTYGCNNACSHCYNEPSRYPMTSLSREDWCRVIDRLHEIGIPHLIMTGGEPTLHPNLPQLIRYADSQGHVVGLNSNGRRLAHRPYLDTLVDAGLNHVQITLGSCLPQVHNAMMGARSFGQTVRGIEQALDSSLHTITNTTLMQANKDHGEEIVQFLHDLGIRTFAMNGLIHSGGGFTNPGAIPENEMPALLLRIRDKAANLGMRFLWYTPTEYCRLSPVELEIGAKRCNAGEYSLCVEPNGDILPCQSYYVAAGNILQDPWEQIWQGNLFRSFQERVDSPRAAGLPEPCWTCPDLPLCAGGCRIEREARAGRRIASGGHDGTCAACLPKRTGAGREGPTARLPLPETGLVPDGRLAGKALRGSGPETWRAREEGCLEP
jgi:radical SAM protein with 4Fe4S-binding SPASM domain